MLEQAQLDALVSTRSTRRTCRDVTNQVEFGLKSGCATDHAS